MKPHISVIVPNYNYEEFLAESIESVLHQSRQADEILVIDDASTDNSLDVIERYQTNPLISVITNESNLGIVENFRKAVEHTTGDWLVFVGADNYVRDDFLEKYERCILEDPTIAVAYCDMIIFGSRAHLLAEKTGAKAVGEDQYHWIFPEPTPDVIEALKHTNFMHGSSLFSREWYERVGGYQKTDDPEDFNLFRSIAFAGGKLVHCPHPTLYYRQHSILQANTQLSLQRELEYYKAHYEAARDELEYYQDEYERLRRREDELDEEAKNLRMRINSLEKRDVIGKMLRIFRRK